MPIIAYWSLSLFFHALDISGWKWLDKYKIHESEEVRRKNLVSRTEVVFAVIFQQVIQTLMGLVWLDEEVNSGGYANVVKGLQRWERLLEPSVDRVLAVLGELQALVGGGDVLGAGASGGAAVGGKEEVLARIAYFMYWWGVPAFQFFAAMYVPFLFI
jgi:sphinganine C4-monooxygenase